MKVKLTKQGDSFVSHCGDVSIPVVFFTDELCVGRKVKSILVNIDNNPEGDYYIAEFDDILVIGSFFSCVLYVSVLPFNNGDHFHIEVTERMLTDD